VVHDGYNSMAMNQAEIERRVRDFFAETSAEIAAVYLFGSVARGTAGPTSDVDIGIVYGIPPGATLEEGPFDIEAALERLIDAPVQVINLNRAPVDLRARVLREGRLLVDRDRSARIRFEVDTRNEAFDLEPILREYRAPRGRRP
jgi:predicted nucleotidyltransferase